MRVTVTIACVLLLCGALATAQESAQEATEKTPVTTDQWSYAVGAEIGKNMQRQQVEIAKALSLNSRIIIMDEPTSALDPELVGEVLDVMRTLAEEGMTMMVVTHEMGFARQVGDRVTFIDGGVVVEENAPEQLLMNPQHERTKKFLEAVQHY